MMMQSISDGLMDRGIPAQGKVAAMLAFENYMVILCLPLIRVIIW